MERERGILRATNREGENRVHVKSLEYVQLRVIYERVRQKKRGGGREGRKEGRRERCH